MSTLYDQINNYCKMGYYPIISNDKSYLIVSPFKDKFANWRDSGYFDTIEECEKKIGRECGSDKEGRASQEEKGFKIIGFYHPPVKRFKKGDKVRVREDLANLRYDNDWEDTVEEYQKTAGLVGVVEVPNSYYYYVRLEKINDWFPYCPDQLEPYIEIEAEKPQTINIGGKEYEVTSELTEALKNLKEIKF